MTWPLNKIADLKQEEKKYLTRYVTTASLRKLGFSEPQIIYLSSFYNFQGIPLKPLFLRNNSVATFHPGLVHDHISSDQGMSFFDWVTMMNSMANNSEPPLFSDNIATTISLDNPEETNPGVDNPINSHDLTVKFADCYGIKGGEVVRIIEFSSESETSTLAYYRPIRKDGTTKATCQADFDDKFNMTLPILGMINFEDHVVIVTRRHKKSSPSRYRKALRADNLQYYNLSSRELNILDRVDKFKQSNDNWDFSLKIIVNDIFFPKKYTYKEALNSVLSFERLATAFSSSMAIKLDSVTNKIVLQKNSWIIGTFNPKNNSFEMIINTFNDQLTELKIPFVEAS